MRRVVRVRVVAPGAEVQLQIDTPSAGPVRPTFRLAGWAFDVGGIGATSGIEAVHVWAFPAAGGSPAFVGAATLGDARPDVAALFGSRASNAGLSPRRQRPGAWRLRPAKPTARPWRCRASLSCRQCRLPSRRGLRPSRCQSTCRLPGRWRVARSWSRAGPWRSPGPSAPGIEAVHVWAYPVGAGAPTFLGAATLGGARPDVGALFGPSYANSGYGLAVSGLASGTWDLAVFPFAAGASGFGDARVVRVTIP